MVTFGLLAAVSYYLRTDFTCNEKLQKLLLGCYKQLFDQIMTANDKIKIRPCLFCDLFGIGIRCYLLLIHFGFLFRSKREFFLTGILLVTGVDLEDGSSKEKWTTTFI